MILCFTGTGNSKFVADALADRLSDEVVSLNNLFKNKKTLEFESEKPFIIVSPIYAWRLPRMVDDVVAKGKFSGNRDIYYVATMGSQTGNSYKFCKKIAEAAGFNFKGLQGIVMPSNYIVAGDVASEESAEEMRQNALNIVEKIAEAVKAGESIIPTDKTKMAGLLSGPVNNMFSKHMIASKDYVVNDNCSSCGNCSEFCPTNNITVKAGEHPVFGADCMNCYGCINRCPQKAINIAGKTEKRGRYVCRDFRA